METIIRNIKNRFNESQSIEELQSNIESYIETYIGHVVSEQVEADQWFSELHEDGTEPTTHFADSQIAYLTLADEYETQVTVRIYEISEDGNTDDYCYMVSITED